MKTIPLTQGQVAMVDDGVYDYLIQWKWAAKWSSGVRSYYAARSQWTNGEVQTVLMHRAIAEYNGYDLTGLEVDHGDHDTLNNQLYNLVPSTHRQNAENQRSNTSGYPGVSWNRAAGKWRAQIMIGGRAIHIGYYTHALSAWINREQYKRTHGIV